MTAIPEIKKEFPIKLLPCFLAFCLVALTVGLLASPYYAYSALPGLMAVILLILARFPQFGYFLMVALIPFDLYRKLSSASETATLSKFIGFWIVLVVFASLLVNKKRTYKVNSNLWPWMLLFLAVSLVSALLSNFHSVSFDELRRLMVAYLFFALTLIFSTSREVYGKTLPRVIIWSVAACSALSVMGSAFSIPLFARFGLDNGPMSLLRATGASQDPNLLSAMIIFSLPLLAHQIFAAHDRQAKIIGLTLFAINLSAIILTYSRGGAILAGVILLILCKENLRRLKPKHFGGVLVAGAAIIIAAAIFIPDTFWQRQKSIANTEDLSLKRRASYLTFGLEAFQTAPILGSGPGTYRELYGHSRFAFYYGEDEEETRFRYAHNSYLELLVGSGVTGLALFLLILWLTRRNFQQAKAAFETAGLKGLATITRAYYLSFLMLILYLAILSALYHKYLWISLALSQIAVTLSREPLEESPDEAARASGGGLIPRFK